MSSGPLSTLTTLVLLASRIVCLIVAVAFVVFVVNQTSSASVHQQNELTGSTASSESSSSNSKHESSLHRTLDEAWETLTSPFAGVLSGSSSEWAIHIVRTALALLVYGLGVAFVVRFIRVRV